MITSLGDMFNIQHIVSTYLFIHGVDSGDLTILYNNNVSGYRDDLLSIKYIRSLRRIFHFYDFYNDASVSIIE